MALYNSFPPHRLHSSHPVAPSEALSLLSSYLETAATEAYLQPNALLTEGGPVSATSGPNTGLIIHNLKRVEAGLRGEHLSTDLELDKLAGEDQADQDVVTTGGALAMMKVITANGDGAVDEDDMGQEGWQDKAEFEHKQDVEVGEVGERAQAVPAIAKEHVTVPKIQETKTTADREDRKKRKKERRKQERREVEQKKKLKSSDK